MKQELGWGPMTALSCLCSMTKVLKQAFFWNFSLLSLPWTLFGAIVEPQKLGSKVRCDRFLNFLYVMIERREIGMKMVIEKELSRAFWAMGGGLFLSSFQRIVVGELWPRYSTQLTKIRIPFPRQFPLILPVSEESHLEGHCPRVILTKKPSPVLSLPSCSPWSCNN